MTGTRTSAQVQMLPLLHNSLTPPARGFTFRHDPAGDRVVRLVACMQRARAAAEAMKLTETAFWLFYVGV